MTILVKAVHDFKTDLIGQPGQFFLTEMVQIAQALATVPPIQQVVAWFNIVLVQIGCLPGLNPGAQSLAVQKLPFRMDEFSTRSQELAHSAQNLQVKLVGRQMVEGGEGQDQIERTSGEACLPAGLRQIPM